MPLVRFSNGGSPDLIAGTVFMYFSGNDGNKSRLYYGSKDGVSGEWATSFKYLTINDEQIMSFKRTTSGGAYYYTVQVLKDIETNYGSYSANTYIANNLKGNNATYNMVISSVTL